ncbi:unnamed protein product, partial [Prorocentrum cordatum]
APAAGPARGGSGGARAAAPRLAAKEAGPGGRAGGPHVPGTDAAAAVEGHSASSRAVGDVRPLRRPAPRTAPARRRRGKPDLRCTPGYRTLVKWGTCFFVPALMGLPVAVVANIELFSSPIVVLKMLVLIAGGYLGSLGATGFLAGRFEEAFGAGARSRTAIPDAVRAAAEFGASGDELARLAAKLQADPGSLQAVIEELPSGVREVLLSQEFKKKCQARFAELDVDESQSLSAE